MKNSKLLALPFIALMLTGCVKTVRCEYIDPRGGSKYVYDPHNETVDHIIIRFDADFCGTASIKMGDMGDYDRGSFTYELIGKDQIKTTTIYSPVSDKTWDLSGHFWKDGSHFIYTIDSLNINCDLSA